MILNSQFYVFLAGRTGRLTALAAIPFHLLFHFYSGLSFLIWPLTPSDSEGAVSASKGPSLHPSRDHVAHTDLSLD